MDLIIQRVLIVEDDPLFQAFLQDALSDEGYATMGCATMAAAQQLVGAAPPDLVILDLQLEGAGSGLDMLTWLRQQRATVTTPVIICSVDAPRLRAQAHIFHAQHCFAAIEKPFGLEDLLTTVYVAIGPARVRYGSNMA